MASHAPAPQRREALAVGLGLVASVWLRPAVARESLAAAVAKFAAGTPVREGKVAIDVAALVENGNTVPLAVSVDSPMSAESHVQTIAIFNERNPLADVAIFHLGPRAGRAQVSLRIRLADTQKLVVVARLSDGSLWSHTAEVVVTIAGCIEN